MNSTKSPETHFFPYGTICPSCEYTLGSVYFPECPECGTPLDRIGYKGSVVKLSNEHLSSIPKNPSPIPDRYIQSIAKHSIPTLMAFQLLFSIGAGLFIWMWFLDSDRHYTPDIIKHMFLGIAIATPLTITCSIVFLFIQGQLKARSYAKLLKMDTDKSQTPFVERIQFHVSHALRINYPSQSWLMLRINCDSSPSIWIIPIDAQKSLEIDSNTIPRSTIELDVLPRSRIPIRLQFIGEPIPIRSTKNCKPKWIPRKLKNLHSISLETEILPKHPSKGSYFTSD